MPVPERALTLLCVVAMVSSATTTPNPGNGTSSTTPAATTTTTSTATAPSTSTTSTTFTATVVGFSKASFTANANVSTAFRLAVAQVLSDHTGSASRLGGSASSGIAAADVTVMPAEDAHGGTSVRFNVVITTPNPVFNAEVIGAVRAKTFPADMLTAFRAYLDVPGCAILNATIPEACGIPPNLSIVISGVHGNPGPPGPSSVALGLGLGLGLGIPLASVLAFALVACHRRRRGLALAMSNPSFAESLDTRPPPMSASFSTHLTGQGGHFASFTDTGSGSTPTPASMDSVLGETSASTSNEAYTDDDSFARATHGDGRSSPGNTGLYQVGKTAVPPGHRAPNVDVAKEGKAVTASAHLRTNSSGTGLMNRRVNIIGKGTGVVVGVKKSFGKTTRHTILFDNGTREDVVLRKEPGDVRSKGYKFYVDDGDAV